MTGRAEAQTSKLVDVHPVRFDRDEQPTTDTASVADDAPTDLDLLIDAIVEANARARLRRPAPVWPEPLGARVGLLLEPARLRPGADTVVPVVGGVEGRSSRSPSPTIPGSQRQLTVGWDLDRGNLLLLGIPGSGTTTTALATSR